MTNPHFDTIVDTYLRDRRAEHYRWLLENAPTCSKHHVLNQRNTYDRKEKSRGRSYLRCKACHLDTLHRCRKAPKPRGKVPRVSTEPIVVRLRYLAVVYGLNGVARRYGVQLKALQRILTGEQETLTIYKASELADRLHMDHASTLWPEASAA